MSIASDIKAFYNSDYTEVLCEAEERSVREADQDYDLETSTYTFADNSVLVFCNGEVNAYGCAS